MRSWGLDDENALEEGQRKKSDESHSGSSRWSMRSLSTTDMDRSSDPFLLECGPVIVILLFAIIFCFEVVFGVNVVIEVSSICHWITLFIASLWTKFWRPRRRELLSMTAEDVAHSQQRKSNQRGQPSSRKVTVASTV